MVRRCPYTVSSGPVLPGGMRKKQLMLESLLGGTQSQGNQMTGTFWMVFCSWLTCPWVQRAKWKGRSWGEHGRSGSNRAYIDLYGIKVQMAINNWEVLDIFHWLTWKREILKSLERKENHFFFFFATLNEYYPSREHFKHR